MNAAQEKLIVNHFRSRKIGILSEVMEKLESEGVDVAPYWKYITPLWWEKVETYLTPHESTSDIIRSIRTNKFFAFEYFLHECIEISYYEDRGIPINKKSNNPGHIEALRKEYQLLLAIAKSFKYKVSIGALVDKHPILSAGTKGNDKNLLRDVGKDLDYSTIEGQDTTKFYETLKNFEKFFENRDSA